MATAHEVADWLVGLSGVESARPVKVKIGKHEFIGAHYVSVDVAQPTERVVTEGPMEAGETIRSNCITLLGDKPKLRRANNVFVAECDRGGHPLERCYEDSNEWYIGCYYDQGVPNDYSPFGNNFTLMHHTPMNFGYYKGWKIDTGDEHEPYDRVPMTIEYL